MPAEVCSWEMGVRFDLVAITVCKDYAGELACTLPVLASQCDAVYVVCDPSDFEVLSIVRRCGATPVEFSGWTANGAKFNKSGAVSAGQKRAHSDWPEACYLVVDADIVIPNSLRLMIDHQARDRTQMYGIDRDEFVTWDHYQSGVPDNSQQANKESLPWAGYFQLYWQPTLYSEWSYSAAVCDLDFSGKFPRKTKLVGAACKHLGFGAQNWQGRTTPAWGPPRG